MAFRLKAGVASTSSKTVSTSSGPKAKSANREAFETFAEQFKSLHTLWNAMSYDLLHRQTLLVELIDSMFNKVPTQFRKVQMNVTNCRTIADLEAYQWNMTMAVNGLQLK